MDLIDLVLGAAAMAVVWLTLIKNREGMTPLQRYRLGKSLADMTSAFELYERVGGDLNSLGQRQGVAMERVFETAEARLRACGPHLVTRELLKNMRLASALGRTERVMAQNTLLIRLIDRGLAADPQVFI